MRWKCPGQEQKEAIELQNWAIYFAKPVLTGLISVALVCLMAPASRAQSAITFSPSSANFGGVAVGQSSTIMLTITNNTRGDAQLTSATSQSPEFGVSGIALPTLLSPGQRASLTLTFSPTYSGSVSSSISLAGTIGGTYISGSYPVSGTGTSSSSSEGNGNSGSSSPAALSVTPSPVAFGNVIVGQTNSQTIQLKNSGNSSVSITATSTSGSGVSLSGISTPFTLGANQTSTFNVNFSPTSAGSVTGSFSIYASNTTVADRVSGTGTAASLQLSANPTGLSFGNVMVGSSATHSAIVTNTGNASVTISGVSMSGSGFSVSGISSGTTLSASQSATLTITFAPTSSGSVSGTVTVASNANSASISVSGSGTSANAAHSVNLTWNASSTSGVVAYNIYRSTNGGAYTMIVSSVSSTQYTDTNVQPESQYSYAVTAVGSNGEESSYSNEISVTVP